MAAAAAPKAVKSSLKGAPKTKPTKAPPKPSKPSTNTASTDTADTASKAAGKVAAAAPAKAPAKATASPAAKAASAPTPKPLATNAGSGRAAPPARRRGGLLPTLPGDRPWTEKEVTALRAALEAEAGDLRGEIDEASAAFDRNMHDGDPTTGDEADAGSATFEREHDLSLAANSRDLLAQVERALERLEAGTYGRCEVCGEPIGKERLKAFPRVTLCVTCKQRENRR